MAKKRALHCWHGGPSIVDWVEAGNDPDDHVDATCMLERGHDGPHQYTRDDMIGITFVDPEVRGN